MSSGVPKRVIQAYQRLNKGHPPVPPIDSDVKFVQCDGCDRVITHAVFHSFTRGGVDLCNICRVAASCSINNTIATRNRTKLSFEKHPILFRGLPPPLPEGITVDKGEANVTAADTHILRKRFDKEVRVVTGPVKSQRRRQGPPKRARAPGFRPEARVDADDERVPEGTGGDVPATAKSRSNNTAEGGECDGAPEVPPQGRRSRATDAESASSDALTDGQPESQLPVLAGGAFDGSDILHLGGLLESEVCDRTRADPEASACEGCGEGFDGLAPISAGPARQPVPSSTPPRRPRKLNPREELQVTLESGSVAQFFRCFKPGIRVAPERARSSHPSDLSVVGADSRGEVRIRAGHMSRVGDNLWVGLCMCPTIVDVAVVPTLPNEGIWIAILSEEDYVSQLEIWQVTPSHLSEWTDDAEVGESRMQPMHMYTAKVGWSTTLAMNWLPVSLPHEDNNLLGLCTLIRGQFLVSTALPQLALANGVPQVGATVSAEVCGAQPLSSASLTPVSAQWCTDGRSLSNTYLFVVCRCLTVCALRPTGEWRERKLSLTTVMHVSATSEPVHVPPYLASIPLAASLSANGLLGAVTACGKSLRCISLRDSGATSHTWYSSSVTAVEIVTGGTVICGVASGDINLTVAESGKVGDVIVTTSSPPVRLRTRLRDVSDGTGVPESLLVCTAAGQTILATPPSMDAATGSATPTAEWRCTILDEGNHTPDARYVAPMAQPWSLKPLCQVLREPTVGGQRDSLSICRTFDAVRDDVARPSTAVQFALHPFWGLWDSCDFGAMFFSDGALVVCRLPSRQTS